MMLIPIHLDRNLTSLILQTSLQLKFLFQTSPLIIIMPCFRIPARRYEFFLVLFFATDEINKNPDLLPNISLIFWLFGGQCEDEWGVLDTNYSQNNINVKFINYDCLSPACYIDLTGPSWKTSLKMSIQSRTPKVRICDTG